MDEMDAYQILLVLRLDSLRYFTHGEDRRGRAAD